ncbi:unnamed protein product [Ostreobium quekettii]|uniref:Uncharacterized protein n=1 Tax=Ostreobium quekettii TaxID=121088 RepID=A0A8S1J5R8_9CHLO|nr:unnamed protein product [Ostreobium quekettii]|eukprot:evm.model.scf_1552.2 EVM.evm.TU.scf_1552.2   scf_1552:15148-15828(-)
MIGNGASIKTEEKEVLLRAMQHVVFHGVVREEDLEMVQLGRLLIKVFQQAVITTQSGANMISSRSYQRSHMRCNQYVTMKYINDNPPHAGTQVVYGARIQFFVANPFTSDAMSPTSNHFTFLLMWTSIMETLL